MAAATSTKKAPSPTIPSDKELTLRIDRARWHCLREQPFYGSLAMGLRDILCDNVPTACTDGNVIRWGRKFLSELTDEETRFVLLHEAMHPAHGHLWRLPHDRKANIVGDWAINATLATVPGIKMPQGGLLPPAGRESFAEEENYSWLPTDDQGGGDGGQGGTGDACGDFTAPADDDQDAGSPSPSPDVGSEGTGEGSDSTESPEDLRDVWERRVIQAAQAAAALGKGNAPADMQRILDRVKHQPIDWRQELAEFVRNTVEQRNDWSRSARRHAWQSVIYPRRRVDGLATVIFARDTSGSIDAVLLAEFSALISSALADVGCRGIVLDCDAAIQDEIHLTPGETCPLTAKGGGGTDHRPIWERAAEMAEAGEKIAGIVCLTDTETTWPEDDGGFAVLTLSTTKGTCPFGRTVRIES
jgi:predicted metal-dependent peptidase